MRPWWIRLCRYALPHWRGTAVLGALAFAGVGMDVLKPWPMMLLVDGVFADDKAKNLPAWAVDALSWVSPVAAVGALAFATVALFALQWGIGALQSYLQVGLGNRMVYDLGGRLFDHLQRQTVIFHGKHRTCDLVRRVLNDAGCVRALVLWVMLPAASSLVSLVTMFLVMWRLDPPLTLLAMAAAPFLAVLIKLFAGVLAERSYRQQQVEGEVMALAEETLTALPIVQAFGREEHEDARFKALAGRAIEANVRSTMSGWYFKVGTTTVTAMGTAAVIIVGGGHVLDGKLSLGSLLVFLAYLASLYAPLETMSYLSSQFASAAGGARRVLEVLDARDAVAERPGAVLPSPGPETGFIRLEGVVFGYEKDRPVLRGIDLEARPGQVVALVGPTGAGKSTLVSLIPRLFDVWEGRVTLGGLDVRDAKLDALRGQIAIVLQEPFLLPLSVAENIAYGRPGASRQDVVAAAQAADAEEFITQLPEGYDTVIGERGATLSGGQRQRLSIARAILKDAPVLILDEPTSALDVETEASVMRALERLMKGRTTLVIAHRLSTVRRADVIVFLQEGRIIERGSHAELLKVDGPYRHFHELQAEEAKKK
ncbi:MAG: ABC transporter ATP-binding protein [Planctomycetota bacterium]|nr:ABC transporter ATP-binding protein [Planctomycetota bacterium]